MRLKIGHFQCASAAGDLVKNLETVKRGLEQAVAEKLDIVSFPESLLGGYFENEQEIRKHSYRLDGPEIKRVLAETRSFPIMFLAGFFELRGSDVYNTVAVCEQGQLIGTYSKAFPCTSFETPGRKFDVFEKKGVIFGIVICADGGFIEPTRIQALKGARIIFAPHYNYLSPATVVDHFLTVRNDHIARAVENSVWFLRANNFTPGIDSGLKYPGVGYGDSYLLDPNGDVVARAGLHRETLMSATIDTEAEFYGRACMSGARSRDSANELGELLREAAQKALKPEAKGKKARVLR